MNSGPQFSISAVIHQHINIATNLNMCSSHGGFMLVITPYVRYNTPPITANIITVNTTIPYVWNTANITDCGVRTIVVVASTAAIMLGTALPAFNLANTILPANWNIVNTKTQSKNLKNPSFASGVSKKDKVNTLEIMENTPLSICDIPSDGPGNAASTDGSPNIDIKKVIGNNNVDLFNALFIFSYFQCSLIINVFKMAYIFLLIHQGHIARCMVMPLRAHL